MRVTQADWVYFAKFTVAAFVVFYLRVWFLESSRAGSWRAGHAMLCKKPKRWQLITLLSSLEPHTYRIHRRVFNSTVKLTHYRRTRFVVLNRRLW